MNIYTDHAALDATVRRLNGILAGYQIFYQTLRGFHWNIRGKDFFEMHALFEKWYYDAAEKIDALAERILTLGAIPLHGFEEYITASPLQSVKNIDRSGPAMEWIKRALEILLHNERELWEHASAHGDEGTAAMMSAYMEEQEKLLWMIKAYLS